MGFNDAVTVVDFLQSAPATPERDSSGQGLSASCSNDGRYDARVDLDGGSDQQDAMSDGQDAVSDGQDVVSEGAMTPETSEGRQVGDGATSAPSTPPRERAASHAADLAEAMRALETAQSSVTAKTPGRASLRRRVTSNASANVPIQRKPRRFLTVRGIKVRS